jgi:predicted ester cyclase
LERALSTPDEDLVRRSVAALNRGDVDGYLAGFSPSCVRWVSGLDIPLGLPDVAANLRRLSAAFDHLHLDEELLFGGSGHVFARWTLRGVHTGHYGGFAPTHRAIEVQTNELYAVDGQVVTESWVFGEMTALFDQLKEQP